MAELNPIYETNQVCPVCENKFMVTKTRSRFIKLKNTDSDFCPFYDTLNPIFYEAWVCKNCGYASHSSTFSDINKYEKSKVKEKISSKWTSRDFSGERTWDDAIEAFKIVLYNLQIREAKSSEFAKLCLRIAWLYRYKSDIVLEHKFLEYAQNYYEKTYLEEEFPIGNMDMFTCLFIIGELNRRIGNYKKALSWLGTFMTESSKPENKDKVTPILKENARDMINETRQMMKREQVDKDA